MRRFAPLFVFVALVALLGAGLTLRPREVPSPLIGKPAPAFSVPNLVNPDEQLTHTAFQGKVSLLNVWATWCVGCRDEHPMLMEIARTSATPIYGLNYKDQYRPALEWLARHGDPYAASGYDAEGRAGLDYGVYGLPETFVVDANGRIAHKHIGPITPQVWRNELQPIIERLKRG